MPTYSYICKKCERGFEVQQSFSDQPLTKCDDCGGELRKVFGNLGVTFKGTGFYRTDSATKSDSSSSD
jgi:putative FmdB family regulatory protein